MKIYNDTAENVLHNVLKEKSVDMILCDPLYGTTSCKWDSIIPFDVLWSGINRVVRAPHCAKVFTASQPFTTALIQSNIKEFKYCWVWFKRVSANVAVAKYQPMKVHEDVVVFNGKYTPLMVKGKMRKIGGRANKGVTEGLPPVYYDSDMRYPTSVLDIKAERGLHPTQKPVELMAYLIETYTNPGDVVLDFAMGSGTTGVACKLTGREFIGVEKDPTIFNVAQERLRLPLKALRNQHTFAYRENLK